ncbi:hypothetical protein EYF80_020866 [Liparis tanakae]|uniref:Uncharacterized protein n=1 Tax=Liparis tanakae TaxID=230148 RepID=A0A4Z2HTF4_9TELE|nr:hypothetical protein EYF80_020866 [Liparis tanakae]
MGEAGVLAAACDPPLINRVASHAEPRHPLDCCGGIVHGDSRSPGTMLQLSSHTGNVTVGYSGKSVHIPGERKRCA